MLHLIQKDPQHISTEKLNDNGQCSLSDITAEKQMKGTI